MAAVHGKDTVIYAGAYNLTSYFRSVSVNREVDLADTSTFGSSAKTYIAGQSDGTMDLDGLFDGAANAVDDRLNAMLGTATVVTVGLGGDTLGNAAKLMNGITASYNIDADLGDVVAVSASIQASGGVDAGKWLKALAAVSATANYTAIDNGAASTNGYAANLHVTDVTGSPTTVTYKVQHSTDNSTFADLATFTNVTAATSEQKTGTGTVNRYLRGALTALSGGTSPTVTAAMAAARR